MNKDPKKEHHSLMDSKIEHDLKDIRYKQNDEKDEKDSGLFQKTINWSILILILVGIVYAFIQAF